MVNSCCAPGCKNHWLKGSSLSFYRFPADPVKREGLITGKILYKISKSWDFVEDFKISGKISRFHARFPGFSERLCKISRFQLKDFNGDFCKFQCRTYRFWIGCLQSLNWASELTLKIIFMLSNETHSPVELCGNPAALFLATCMVPEQITHQAYSIREGLCIQCVMAFSSHIMM